MKKSTILKLAIVSSLSAVGVSTIDSTTASASTSHSSYVTSIYKGDQHLLNEYRTAALQSNDYKFYMSSNRIIFKVARSYKNNPNDLSFDNIAQQFLVTKRFIFQRDTNQQFNNQVGGIQ